MKFKFFFSSNIIDLPEKDNGQDIIDFYLQNITKDIEIDSLQDWTLIFTGLLSNSEKIGIYKRGMTYPNDKEKDMTLIIPVPFKKQISWGIEEKRFASRSPLKEKLFTWIEIDYNEYDSLKDFIVDCIKKAIKTSLEDGITLQKKKIKIEKS